MRLCLGVKPPINPVALILTFGAPVVHLCYVDESGTPEVPGTTSHFVLAGIAVPIWHWRDCDREVGTIKNRYGLYGVEIHTAWMLRAYQEQSLVPNFESLGHAQRRREIERIRNKRLLNAQRRGGRQYRQMRKNFLQTHSYIHLTRDERRQFVREVADCVGNWGFARLFADCIDKLHYDPARQGGHAPDEQAFEQVVSRFEQYLRAIGRPDQKTYGLVIHDNNQTVAKKHTEMMASFHRKGTLWTRITNIIETPLFVDSHLTSMVQIADLCGYALRRYVENGESDLFDRVFVRGDRRNDAVVGIRHFTDSNCPCTICKNHTNAS